VTYFGLGAQQDLAVLEIGSYDVNGSFRSFFDAEDYVVLT